MTTIPLETLLTQFETAAKEARVKADRMTGGPWKEMDDFSKHDLLVLHDMPTALPDLAQKVEQILGGGK